MKMDRSKRDALIAGTAALAAVVAAVMLHEWPNERSTPPSNVPAAETRPLTEATPTAPLLAAESRPAISEVRSTAFVNKTGITGRVVGDDGTPIAGAKVTAGVSPEVQTDEIGRFAATGLEGAACNVFAEAPGFAWRAVKGVRLVPDATVDVTIVLEARPEHLGRVVGPDDAPVPGADVVIQFGRMQAFAGATNEREISRETDEGGWFSFPPSDARLPVVEVRARKSGTGSGRVRGTGFSKPEVVTIRLEVTRTLVCKFAFADGAPAQPDLRFSIRGGSNTYFFGVTDARGACVVTDFPPVGSVTVSGFGDGWAVVADAGRPMTRSFSVAPAGDVEVAVPLTRRPPPDPLGTVEGIVTDASGRPIAGAVVNSQMPVATGLEATSALDGRFRLTGIMPVKNCRVGASRGRGPLTWSEPFILGSGAIVTGVTIVVGAKPDLIVDVVDPDGHPAAGVAVVLEDVAPTAIESTRAVLATDSRGRAAFDAAPGVVLRVGVDPASLPAGVGADQDENDRVVLATSRDAPFVIRLRRDLVLRGTLVEENGAPINGGTLRFVAGNRPAPPVHELVHSPPPGLAVDRYVNVSPGGEFTFRVRSRLAYEVRELRRMVRGHDAGPRWEVFDPVASAKLEPDVPNVVAVKRRDD